MASSVINVIATFILQLQTSKDHQNITNEELDWKYELEKREMVVVSHSLGGKIEKKTHIAYKKERIGPWTWMVPILMATIAVGFGVLANFHPKLEMKREPKGSFTRLIDDVHTNIDKYQRAKSNILEETETECLPWLGDVLEEDDHFDQCFDSSSQDFLQGGR